MNIFAFLSLTASLVGGSVGFFKSRNLRASVAGALLAILFSGCFFVISLPFLSVVEAFIPPRTEWFTGFLYFLVGASVIGVVSGRCVAAIAG